MGLAFYIGQGLPMAATASGCGCIYAQNSISDQRKVVTVHSLPSRLICHLMRGHCGEGECALYRVGVDH